MKHFTSEIHLPQGKYKERKDFQFCLFLHTATENFAQKYLFDSSFSPLKRKLLEDDFHALSCACDAYFHLEKEKEKSCLPYKLLFRESGASYRELTNILTTYLKMKRMRLFSADTPCMHRFRSFHIRSMEEFRTWISIERYDSDLLHNEICENKCKETLYYPSSAELAANGLIRIGRCCSFLMRHLAEKKNTF
ncbi:MAG: hypothetical protein IKC08_05505 [Lentisphaeria bacterium]|nr:hypothetical protein [Lentisphaeria bacterium]